MLIYWTAKIRTTKIVEGHIYAYTYLQTKALDVQQTEVPLNTFYSITL